MLSELAFRAQLVIREQRDLFDYWRGCAGGRPMPRRADISPADMAAILPNISILDAGGQHDQMTYRLAGTRLREIYGCEVTGKSVFDLEFGEKRDYWLSIYRRVLDEKIPMQGAVKGPVVERDHMVLFWMRLPLSDNDCDVNKVLCHDVSLPVSAAYGVDSMSGAMMSAS